MIPSGSVNINTNTKTIDKWKGDRRLRLFKIKIKVISGEMNT